MSYEQPTKVWSLKDIDRFLKLMRVIDEPGFRCFDPKHEYMKEEVMPNGEVHFVVKGFSYHPVVRKMLQLLYRSSAYIDAYQALPEDPTQEGIPFSVLGTSFSEEYFESATLNQVRRYLILVTRGERFCDGHIMSEFENGTIHWAVRRLRILRSEMKDRPELSL